jgi:formate hydrogenlyase subunit 4
MNWFHQLSSTELAAIVVVVTLVVSMTGLAITARKVRETKLHETMDNGTVAGLLAALIGIYAIAAGLTAVAVWGNTGEAAANVGREAAAINVLWHDLGGYPQPVRNETRRAVMDYTRYVIDKEWPLHRRGEAPSLSLAEIERFQATLFAFEPATEGQKILHAQAVGAYNRLLEARRLRLQAVEDTALPLELWVVVLLLGAIAISACFLLRVDSFAMHATITILVAAPIALILYFIAVTDRPFQGGVAVSTEPYRAILERIMVPEFGGK